MNHTQDADVIIVGAGIAGSGLACALTRYNLRILLLEKRRRLGSIHRGDSLVPKNTALLAQWGILEAFIQAGAEPITHMELHHHRYGRIYRAPLLAPGSSPYLVLPHAKIERTLLDQALATGKVKLIQPAKAVNLLRRSPDAISGICYQDEQGTHEAYAPLVVGADGYKSVVREQMSIEVAAYHYDHAYFGLEAQRPAHYENAMRVHLHPDGGILLMPRPDRVGVGVLVAANSANYWLKLPDAELAQILIKRAPILEGMPLYREGSHVYSLVRSHAQRYWLEGVVIIGDAAHTTNPTAGQGMAMALSDAGALAEQIGPVLAAGETTLTNALNQYGQQQWSVNQKLVRSSHHLALLYAKRGQFWHWLKTAGIKILANPLAVSLTRPVIAAFLERA
ncbi:MAG: FAD-dependent monooxygenase [Thioploca sp.]|nr:FAD-dependent monooxygenase [Thioploca sp.]